MLTAAGLAPEEQDALLADLARPEAASPLLTGRERALLTYADKLTIRPGGVTAGDVEALRAAGLDDRAIHDACAVIAYFAFVNRIADGLGVDIEQGAMPNED